MNTKKKMISILLVAALLITTIVVACVPASAATGTLASYYKTNPDGKVGKQATITIDGDASDWSEDMMIAQGAAWDCPNQPTDPVGTTLTVNSKSNMFQTSSESDLEVGDTV